MSYIKPQNKRICIMLIIHFIKDMLMLSCMQKYIYILYVYYELYQFRKILYFIIIDGWLITFKRKHIFRVHKSSVLYHNFSLFINKQAKKHIYSMHKNSLLYWSFQFIIASRKHTLTVFKMQLLVYSEIVGSRAMVLQKHECVSVYAH